MRQIFFLSLLSTLAVCTIYISVTGQDTSVCGTTQEPCKTINYALTNRLSTEITSVTLTAGIYRDFGNGTKLIVPSRFDNVTIVGVLGVIFDLQYYEHFEIFVETNLTISSIEFKNGYTKNKGGAIYFNGPSNVSATLQNCNFYDSIAEDSNGGAVMADGIQLQLKECIFSNNSAFSGGAISSSSIDISQSTFQHNRAISAGGAIHCDGVCHLNIMDSYIYNNTCVNDGGGIFANNYTGVMKNSSIVQNSAKISGGGLLFTNTDAILEFLRVENNSAMIGAGLSLDCMNLKTKFQVRGSRFNFNKALYGGGITIVFCWVPGVLVDISNSSIYSNEASLGPGAQVGKSNVTFSGTYFKANAIEGKIDPSVELFCDSDSVTLGSCRPCILTCNECVQNFGACIEGTSTLQSQCLVNTYIGCHRTINWVFLVRYFIFILAALIAIFVLFNLAKNKLFCRRNRYESLAIPEPQAVTTSESKPLKVVTGGSKPGPRDSETKIFPL
eukprot:TRINITY_DN1073_c0_g1_i4.p1 TRINITY_DN1073_c0_g1~~TRINITY_DN1073_c0_g1_i4.p1  ORF type:complete len:500 (-),score=64.64 TRINITY_DN1073_c0_g1_i4:129-1628(-)